MLKKKDVSYDTKLLQKLKKWQKEAIFIHRGSRLEAREAYEYMRGNMLPDDVIWELQQRSQPISWENAYQEIDSKIEGLTLLGQQEVKAVPRRVLNRKRVEIINDTLKSFRDSTEYETNKKLSNRDLRLSGLTAMEVKLKVVKGEVDALGKPLHEVEYIYRPALELFFDPYAQRPDFSDGRFITHSRLVHASSLPKLAWKSETMVRLNRTWYRDEEYNIRFCMWVEEQILQDIPSPYRNLDRFPIALRKLYEGTPFKEYYGMYRNIKPLQDKLNFIMLRVSNMLGSKKILVESDAVDDIEEFAEGMSRDDSVLEMRPDALKNKKWADVTSMNNIPALMQLAQDTRAKMKTIVGVNDELLGIATSRLSGDAMELRKEAGLAGLQNFLDVQGELDKDIAEITVPIVQQYFTAEQLLVVRDSFTNEPKEVPINAYHRDPKGRLVYQDVQGARKPKRKNIIDSGRFTFFLVKSPVTRGATGERSRTWAELMKVLQVARPDVVANILPSMLRDIDSPVADEVREIVAKMDEMAQQNQQANQEQMQAMQLELKEKVAKIAELESKANLNNAKAGEIRPSASPLRS